MDAAEPQTVEAPAIELETYATVDDARKASHTTDGLELDGRRRAPLLLHTSAHPTMLEHAHELGGRLITPRHYSSIEATSAAGIPWAADNDGFNGVDVAAWETMLERIAGLPGCLFATVPDRVAEAGLTDLDFEEHAATVHRYGLPAAYVLQDDGSEYEPRGIPWGAIDALFIGGSDTFKMGPAARQAAREAKQRGLWVHWGRVNTRRRLDYIKSTGAADSFDGTKWARFRDTYLAAGLELAGAPTQTALELDTA